MNEIKEESKKKDSVLKSFAVAGFVGIIILITWLSIQLVHVLPVAFSSLASLGEVMNQKKTAQSESVEIMVSSDTELINSGEVVSLTWNAFDTKGAYTFSYTCIDGVSVAIINLNRDPRNVTCDTNYNIGNVDNLSITAESKKKRSETLSYTIAFWTTNDTVSRAEKTAIITILNESIEDPSNIVEEEVPVVNEEVVAEEPEPETEPEVERVEVVTPKLKPVYQQQLGYEIPVSNPNGQTDLYARFLATGRILGSTFFGGTLVQNGSGAIQFEVKNYGTKTSDDWTYGVTLPGGGEYTSPKQKPLKPNERAVLTLGFPTTDNNSHTFTVTVKVSSDRNTANNKFSQRVSLIK